MKELINQFSHVPPDIFYLIGLLIGACLSAIFTDNTGVLQAVRNFFLSLGGGIIIMLLLTGIWTTAPVRVMCGVSVAMGFLGAFMLHKLWDNRSMVWDEVADYLKYRRERSKARKDGPPKREAESIEPPNIN